MIRFQVSLALAAVAAIVFGGVSVAQSGASAYRTAASDPPPNPALLRPLQLVEAAERAFENVQDYRCIFIKREFLDGELQPYEFILLKVRNRPFSVYMRWLNPRPGREVIFAPHLHGFKIIAHEVGVKGVVGTVEIDPNSSRARKESRHPITEIGIGNLIRKIKSRWTLAARDPRYRVEIKPNARVGNRPCILVKTFAPPDPQRYEYARARVFFDGEHGLPIRVEGYGWPTRSYPQGVLLEEYTYDKLELNVGLTDLDFSPNNPEYNF